MKRPTDPAVQKAFAELCEMGPFKTVAEWLKKERDTMDKNNRIRGQENLHTAAYALSIILDEIETAKANKAQRLTM